MQELLLNVVFETNNIKTIPEQIFKLYIKPIDLDYSIKIEHTNKSMACFYKIPLITNIDAQNKIILFRPTLIEYITYYFVNTIDKSMVKLVLKKPLDNSISM